MTLFDLRMECIHREMDYMVGCEIHAPSVVVGQGGGEWR
jgi:hypothetical protein